MPRGNASTHRGTGSSNDHPAPYARGSRPHEHSEENGARSPYQAPRVTIVSGALRARLPAAPRAASLARHRPRAPAQPRGSRGGAPAASAADRRTAPSCPSSSLAYRTCRDHTWQHSVHPTHLFFMRAAGSRHRETQGGQIQARDSGPSAGDRGCSAGDRKEAASYACPTLKIARPAWRGRQPAPGPRQPPAAGGGDRSPVVLTGGGTSRPWVDRAAAQKESSPDPVPRRPRAGLPSQPEAEHRPPHR